MRTSRSPLSFVSTLAFAALVPTAGLAQTTAAPAPPAPDYTLTANVGLFSEYIFRGISQTAGKPAVQGGFDWGHSSGFYLGTWASNISWLEDFGAYTRSSLEWDFYGGYKGNFPGSDDWTYDLGTIYYYYPGTRNPGVVERQHLGSLRRAQLEVARRQGVVQPRRLLRRATHREEDRRHLVLRLLRQLSGRRDGLHAARPLRDPQRQSRRKREHARRRTTTGSSAPRTRWPTARSRDSKSARITAATTPRRRSTRTSPATTPRRTSASSTSRRRSERGPVIDPPTASARRP